MAAYEDFEFFRAATWRAAKAPPTSIPHLEPATATPVAATRGQTDALRAELERLHVEVRRMRAHVRGKGRRPWHRHVTRFVSRLLPLGGKRGASRRAPALRESA